MGSVDDAYDNALMETINGLYKAGCIRTTVCSTTAPSPTSSTPPPGWVDWYKNRRLHSTLRNVPPVEYEESLYEKQDQPGGGLTQGLLTPRR